VVQGVTVVEVNTDDPVPLFQTRAAASRCWPIKRPPR
jgi:hypothetical protein